MKYVVVLDYVNIYSVLKFSVCRISDVDKIIIRADFESFIPS